MVFRERCCRGVVDGEGWVCGEDGRDAGGCSTEFLRDRCWFKCCFQYLLVTWGWVVDCWATCWSLLIKPRFQGGRTLRTIGLLQEDLDRLAEWSEVWQLRFNVDKCKVMHMGRGNSGGNYVILRVQVSLGILRWGSRTTRRSLHNVLICAPGANRGLGMINRTMVYRSSDILTRL